MAHVYAQALVQVTQDLRVMEMTTPPEELKTASTRILRARHIQLIIAIENLMEERDRKHRKFMKSLKRKGSRHG